MSINKIVATALLVLSALLPTTSATAAGLLTPADNSLPALQIRSHAVEVLIQDGYAVTSVDCE